MKNPILKNFPENSVITEIGAFFRRINELNWRINIGLEPKQDKGYVSISQIPLLARKSVLNPTTEPKQAGYPKTLVIGSTQSWRSETINTCPIPAVKVGNNKNEWCFVFENEDICYYLPQLELARVLFLHNAYMVRLSLINQGISKEFDLDMFSLLNDPKITILPNCSLPAYARADYSQRRILAWIILHDDTRRSFDSIYAHLRQESYEKGPYHLWHFRFDPPPLTGTQLTFNGQYDKKSQTFFIYQIHGITKLPSFPVNKVYFIDPAYTETQSGTGAILPANPSRHLPLEIDDDQSPGVKSTTQKIELKSIELNFACPFQTQRVGNKKKVTGNGQSVEDGFQTSTTEAKIVSTDESTVLGSLPSADFDSIDDTSDDAHLYADKFKAFDEMVKLLVSMPDCQHVTSKLRKLPALKRHKRHLLADGNPRCLSFHVVRKNGKNYALIEVDTSDDSLRLSMLLIKPLAPSSPPWEVILKELERLLVERSLSWPITYLKRICGEDYRRISHPKTSLDGQSAFAEEAINRWAERVYMSLSE